MRTAVRLLGLYPFDVDDKGNTRIKFWPALRGCVIVIGSCIFNVIITYALQTRTELAGSIIYHIRRECFALLMILAQCSTFCYYKETETVEKMLASLERGFKKKGAEKDHWQYIGAQVVATVTQQIITTADCINLKVATNVAMNIFLYCNATVFESTLNRIARCSRYYANRLAAHPSRAVVSRRVTLVDVSRTVMKVYSFKVASSLLVCFVFIVANLDHVVAQRSQPSALVIPMLYNASYAYLIAFILIKPCVQVVHADNHFKDLIFVNYLRGIKPLPLGITKRMLSSSERVKFQPWGLFELDFKLITSMLSLTTSYLLIVMQIQK